MKTIQMTLGAIILVCATSIIPAYCNTYEAQSGNYIEGTVAKYLESSNITIFRYSNTQK